MTETLRNRILLGIGLVHLCLVGLGAATLDPFGSGRFGDIMSFYLNLSGAGSSFEGRKHLAQLGMNNNREMEIRLSAIISEFLRRTEGDPMDYRRELAVSLAASVFGQHRDAKQVVVSLEEYWPPTLEEYSEGERGEWTPLYQFTVERSLTASVPKKVG
jgi:hypothetical protein